MNLNSSSKIGDNFDEDNLIRLLKKICPTFERTCSQRNGCSRDSPFPRSLDESWIHFSIQSPY